MVATTEFYADWLAMLKGLMGLAMLLAAVLGVLTAPGKMKPVLMGLWLGYFTFGLVFPYQFTTHEYYHLALVPIVTLSLMSLIQMVMDRLSSRHWIWRVAGVSAIVFAAGYCLYVSRSILYARDYSAEPIAWKRVGEALPVNSRFMALNSDYGMRLRYYGWRIMSGSWPTSADLNLFSLAGSDPLDYQTYFEEVTEGMDYFLVTAFNELEAQPQLNQMLYDNYPIYSEGDGYLIFDLKGQGD